MNIFLSGVSSEFRECRISLASDLRAMGAHVIVQEDLQQKGGLLLEKLQDYIAQCDRVIVLIGEAYGVEAIIEGELQYAGEPRSYTQWEYFFAVGERLDGNSELPKKLYVYVADGKFRNLNQVTQTSEHALRQDAFVEKVLTSGQDRSTFGSLDELCRLAIRDGFQLPQPPNLTPEAGGVQAYLRFLARYLDRIDIGSPAQVISSVETVGPKIPQLLETVCTKCRVRRVLQVTGSQDTLDISNIERDIFAAIADAGKRIVLLGHPGSGKTTAARWLSIRYAQMYLTGRSYSIPIYVPLRHIDISTIDGVNALVDAALLGLESFPDHPEVRQYLKSNHNRLSIVIDGLDELPIRSKHGEYRSSSLQRLYSGLEVFLESGEGHQVLITSRLQDYLHNPDFHYPDAEHLLISDLTIEQIDKCIHNWHRAAQKISVGAADQHVDWSARDVQIRNLVRNDTDLASFAANPLCLNLLQLVYQEPNVRQLSVSRICELAITTLLFARVDDALTPVVADTGISISEYRDLLLAVLSDIAVEAVDSVATGGDGAVPFGRLQSSVIARVGATTATDYLKYGSLIHPVMTEIVRGQGVLISMNAQYFMFAHNLFRDTLAGRALKSSGDAECSRRAKSMAWSKVFRHIAGLALTDTSRVLEVAALAHALYAESRPSGNTVILASAAEIIGEFRMSRETVIESSLFRDFVADMQQSLIRYATDREIPAGHRVELGMLLGRVGDPRIRTIRDGGADPARYFVVLGSGRFTLGAGPATNFVNPKYRSVYPKKLEEVPFGEFSIGRYLVTNDEYAEFIEDGGYSTDHYWQADGGLEWLREDESTISKLRELMRASSMTHFYTDLQNGRITELEINDAIDAMLFRKFPLYWYDRKMNGPNQPVVGVNWWEAKAYARWFASRQIPDNWRDSVDVDLPTEYEWERCAREGGRNSTDTIWASGQHEENAHWNALHRLLPAPSPVGIYPWGSPSPEGPHDLIGNVWEWTTSVMHDYSAERIHDAFSAGGLQDRIVRGGSWLSAEPLSATISFRSFDPPCNAYDDLGFRLVLVSKR